MKPTTHYYIYDIDAGYDYTYSDMFEDVRIPGNQYVHIGWNDVDKLWWGTLAKHPELPLHIWSENIESSYGFRKVK